MPTLAPARPSSDTRRHEKDDRLIAAAQALPELRVAVAHPCDEASIGAACEAATLSLIEPILVGPPGKIGAAATALGVDITAYRRVEAAHSHESAARAVASAGEANIPVVPNLEAGNMLAKSFTFLAGADAAGIVLGARVPIILNSRADSRLTRLASCAVASLFVAGQRAARLMPEV
ncbi:MAG: hypothetical protein EKK43_21800 [Methylobacterium sp.]|uniref:phosphate acyltransferase n=1 Tax=Methylobacterium sp. TaxID=409 RepID=UPI000FA18520|nr:phosphate acyltransferase [Methylobacterium sp.]RUP12416.1 MAG: hypothetical protein EKK43_21800 [Methylobacterium sp.]